MARARHLRTRTSFSLWPTSSNLVRSISATISLVLIVTSLVLSPIVMAFGRRPIRSAKSQGQQSQGQERRGTPLPPRTGAPAANLPNLDELRNAAEATRNHPRLLEAPAAIPSTMRSRRKSNQLPPGLRSNSRAQAGSVISPPRAGGIRSHHSRPRTSPVTRSSLNPVAPLPQSGRMNFALGANGSVATSSSTYTQCCGFTPAAAIDGEHKALNYLNGGAWHSETSTFPQWLQVDFNASRTIDEIDVYTLQDNYANPSEPTEAMTFTLYGLTGYDVQYWTGSAWTTVPGGSITGNDKVWKKITFSPITTSKIRVLSNASVDNWSRIPEVEAWGPAASARTNVALASNGSTATASSTYTQCCAFTPAAAIDGEHKGLNYLNGGAWHSGTSTFPQWLQVDFNASRTIDEIDVYTLQDDYANPSEPTEAMTFTLYGLTGFEVQYWNGSAWMNVPGGNVSGNNKVWRKIMFAALTTTRIRLLSNASIDGWSRLPEIEAWSALGGGGTPSDFAMARLDPLNRTGTGGEDLLSNNFNWSLPLVGLPGRGLDLGLTLSYNSLVWIRSGSFIDFDVDKGSVAPGFRLGFPVIEGPYSNSQANANYYLLVTPSGARVELRQNDSGSIVYESKDSSYLQLTDNLNGTMTLRPTDGSQMNFIVAGGGWHCNQIKDRNGNYINVTYKSWGEIETVTDTLGRVLTFNYDGNDNLQSITQSWGGQTPPHEWATFGWGTATIGNNFPSLNNLGPNSTTIPVLTQVGLADGSRYNFEYNNSYGMVSKIRHHASDNRLRRQTTYVAPANASDSPRLTERRDWAANWNGDGDENPTTNEEAVTYFGHDADNGCRITLPDGTVHKQYYGSSWQNGLSTETRSYATVADANSNVWQKKTTTTWTQDNATVGYLTNPRVLQADVEDSSGNHRRTTIDYGAVNLGYVQWGLPHIVREYGVNGATATEFRRSQTDYNLTQGYLDRRIIGLVSSSQLYDAVAAQWQAKITYNYDATAIDSQATTAVMHDQNYNASFTVRGNVTGISRWDVTDINNATKALTATTTFNAAGSMLSTTDPATHTNSVGYAESFSDGNNSRNTFAYPTTLTDADGFQSVIKYNFDSGVVTRTQGPPPAGQPQGRIQTMLYDDALRLTRVTTENNGVYTRYVHGPYYVQAFSTVNAVADEAYSCQILDGHGRAFAVSGNHPNSTGWYRGQMTNYDIMGRIRQQTNWTEVDYAWVPVGDDAAGWQWNNPTEYDWQGRPRKTYNMDGTYKEASYSGCGCAGGEVVTLTDEVNRQQRVYSDVLGRQWKTEVLNWPDGGGNRSVYSTNVSVFSARDQVTRARQYAGVAPAEASSTNANASCPSGTCQETAMTFDGYARLQSKHVPEQDAGSAIMYAYNPDDTIQSVTDARGASATYVYNNRHRVTAINNFAPTGITPTPNVTFGYDAAGNRTSMNDGLGSVSYGHDQLSRMTSETRTFTSVGSYTVSYEYNLAGQLKSVTDPANATINYSFDAAGRPNAVTGSTFGGVTTYASGSQYRAWGGLKHLTYGNGKVMDAGYNSRMQVSSFSIPSVLSKTYDYEADGSLRFSSDLLNHKFDRSYAYDHAAHLTQAFSGAEARGESTTNDRPYKQAFNYDPFGHLTHRDSNVWADFYSIANSYSNDRNQGFDYDAEGNLLDMGGTTYTYDSAGAILTVASTDPQTTTTRSLDGGGQQVKTVASTYNETTESWTTTTTYYVRSTVLGGAVLTELNENGAKHRTFVYAGSEVMATQEIIPYFQTQGVTWEHRDPSNASYRTTQVTGDLSEYAELDPTGADAGLNAPLIPLEDSDEGTGSLLPYPSFSNPARPGVGYSVDGIPVTTDYFARAMEDNYHGSFSGGSLRSSIIGFREAGSRFGTPYRASYDLNGRMTSVWEGQFDASLLDRPLANEASFIYGSSLSIGFNLLPRNLGADPFPKLSKDNLKTVTDSIKFAQDMTKNKKCDEALKAYGIPSLAALINGMTANGNVFDGRTSTLTGPIGNKGATQSVAAFFKENKEKYGAAVFHNSVTGRGSVTFLGDYFFNPVSRDWIAHQRAIIMLHEAVHQIGGKGDPVFGSSKELSEKIIENCYPVLRGKLGGVG
jgi:YD repeat-containing protein